MNQRRNPYPGVGNQPTTDRHGKKRWRLRKTVNGHKVDTYLPGPYGSAEFRAAYDEAVNPTPKQKTAGKFGTIDHVVSHYRGTKAFKTLAASTRYAKGNRLDWICRLVGEARIGNIQPYHIENLMDRKGGPDAANRLLKEISELFGHAEKKMGIKVTNPTGAVDKRKVPEGGYHTWTEAEVQQYRDRHKSGSKARLALELMLATGAARQDASTMGRHNIKGVAIYYRRGKTGQDTELPLKYMPDLVREIRQLPPGTDVFITTEKGKPYTPESFGNWFAEQCEAAGLPKRCRAHGLRKRGATMLAEAGARDLEIMAFLAHKNTRTAMIYTREAERKKMAASGMARLKSEENVSNLSDWLDKIATQTTEVKG